ncbi:MAG: hypothetical protein EAZ89_19345 [Bacteroidetes bacterium]|nr:MAG: hypothetical protein EAZ89_19345 [Bacteroidota bacterium]
MRPYLLLFLVICTPGLISAQYYGVSDPITGQWSLGLFAGSGIIRGDVTPRWAGIQTGIYGSYTLNRGLDMRLSFQGGQWKGMDLTPTAGFRFNSAWNGTSNPAVLYDSTQKIVHNYRMRGGDFAIALKLNLNRLFTSSKAPWDVYLLGGVGAFLYQTDVNGSDDVSGNLYDFESLSYEDPVLARQALLNLLDDTYETPAERDVVNSTRFGPYNVHTNFHAGAGFLLPVSRNMRMGFEARYLFVSDDLLDGQQWDENNEASVNTDKVLNLSLMLEYLF